MPGMELLAPERQDTRRGSLGSPNFFPIMASVAANAASTFRLQLFRILRTQFVIFSTTFCSDGKTGRNGNSQFTHFSKIGTLAAQ